ncbi:MAG: hypothetical protein DRN95_04280 [Candidatus Hydrothermarchaeota archaeon]|nr:MAG: hypothetical protein DRN95_04280 [Candidatus Hydrothermarchaeota archaeon]
MELYKFGGERMNNKNKAISPVIAVILLVGVAIGAAALAYSWYMGIQKGTQEVGGAAAGRTALASSASMTILDVNSTGYVTIYNNGGVNLTSISCTNNNNACSGTISNLAPGSKNSTINCSLGSGVNTIKCTSAEGAVATYQKLV